VKRTLLGALPFAAWLALGACTPTVEPPVAVVDTPDPGDVGAAECDPGNKRIHRLNRTEYDATTRDLLGVDLALAQDFPADDVGYGFDNVADVLSTSPLLVEKLDSAAEALAFTVIASGAAGGVETFEAEVLTGSVGVVGDGEWNLFSNGTITATFTIDVAGPVTLRARAREQAAGPDAAHMTFQLDNVVVAEFDATETAAMYEHVVDNATVGAHTFAVEFTNDYYEPDLGEDRNLLVDFLEVEKPGAAASPARDRIVTCDAAVVGVETCAREIVAGFLPRAFRRPVETPEVEGLVDIVVNAVDVEGASFDEGIALALHAALLSPSFLYRVELDDSPESDVVRNLNAHELASRLSYFLWSSMPDEALFAKAADASLLDADVFAAEIDRMLADPKARALTTALAGQWLQGRSLADSQPNPDRFPEMNDAMKASMRGETERFVAEFLRDDTLTLGDLIDADFTFVDASLAAWYGIEATEEYGADGFARVDTTTSERHGLLTQAAFLTATSYPLRTSPVKRGKWVLEQLLCMPPDPPPPEVIGQFNEDESAGTVRERLEQHRADPNCAACHTMMDPIGFGLERFDPVGRYRETDNGAEINDSDVFLTGDIFHGSRELVAIVKEMPELTTCISAHVATYGIGRGINLNDFAATEGDFCTVEDVARRTKEAGGSLGDLVRSVATTDAFRKRRGEGG
jgi:hypothetical protein